MAAKAPSSPRKPRQAPVRTPGQPAPVGDNSAYREEEERVQLISFLAKATQTKTAVAAAKAPYDAATKAHNQVFALARAANPEFIRKYLEKKMEEMDRAPAENARQKAMERRHDRWLGILTDEQQKMHLEPGTPQEAKDEVDWEARGYATGLRGMEAKLPEGIPPRMDQFFLKGHGIGYAASTAALEANAPKPLGSSVREQAAADFAADEPEVDIDKAARALKNSDFMDTTPKSDEPFEMTEEERAAQAGRPSSEEVV